MLWLYCKFGYMSNRHTLPLVMFTIFCIPVGLQALAAWLEKRFPKGTQVWFIVLIIVGIVICTPKLLRPLHHDKLIFRKAAQWLAENTLEDDLIAIPDSRISFYSGRKGIDYKHHAFSENVRYVVRVYKKKTCQAMTICPDGLISYILMNQMISTGLIYISQSTKLSCHVLNILLHRLLVNRTVIFKCVVTTFFSHK